MVNFIEAFQTVILNEGLYSNDPDDAGGRTILGISENNWPNWAGWKIVDRLNSAKEMATNAELQNLVQSFYLNNFWNQIKGDSMPDQQIANSIFDFAVNAGVKTSVMLAQKVVGVDDDGVIGSGTLTALSATNPRLFIAEFKLAKIDRYCDIVDSKPIQIKYLKGWIRRALK